MEKKVATKRPRRTQPVFAPATAFGRVGANTAQGPSTPLQGDPVMIFRNLNTGTYSQQEYLANTDPSTKSYGNKRWVTTSHPETVNLRNAQFVVSEAGRQRVIVEQRKNVHARVRGIPVRDEDIVDTPDKVTYNPYKYTSFVDENEAPVHDADAVRLLPGGDIRIARRAH